MTGAADYVSFEDRFRGPEADILERLRQYAPLLEAFRSTSGAGCAAPHALDLGCGRGEWISLCRELGWLAEGVDGNAVMVERCRARGLQAQCGDGLAVLQAQPTASLQCLSAFHLIEHLSHAALDALLQQAFRVLRTDGVLILETPNCDTWRVASQEFHLDPTHITRVHPAYLVHRLQALGFGVCVAVGLNGRSRQEQWVNPSLRNALESGAPDLAIVASLQPSQHQQDCLARWVETVDCWSSAQIGDRFEQRIRDLEQRLAQQHDQLMRLQAERVSMRRQRYKALLRRVWSRLYGA